MTFTEDIAIIMECTRNVNNIGCALKTVLKEAQQEGRTIVGVYESAQMLQNTPEEVGLCVLADVAETEDVTIQIHHKLVEAFCWENDIEVVKVSSFKNLGKMYAGSKTDESSVDASCILIRNAKTDNSANDFISNYYSMLANQSPIIDLPE